MHITHILQSSRTYDFSSKFEVIPMPSYFKWLNFLYRFYSTMNNLDLIVSLLNLYYYGKGQD